MSVSVITGTTGSTTLRETIRSVQSQIHPGTLRIEHWIIIDGEEFERPARAVIEKSPAFQSLYYTQHVLVLPENTGGSGYLCHRINAALPWLVNTDYVCFLDEDNEMETDHLRGLMNAIGDARWAFSFRKIIDHTGAVVCLDKCESLGSMSHTVCATDDRHIDTNCYLLHRDLAVQLSPLWNVKARQPGQLEADRHVCRVLLSQEPHHGVSRNYSIKYRVSGRHDSVRDEFFLKGNEVLGRGVGGYDASKKDVYLFHFDPKHTFEYCHGPDESSPLGEWCPGMWHGLKETYNLIDGFANLNFLPLGATCLIAMCSPSTLPLDIFKTRKDLAKILYTAEGPNIRHKEQWSKDFLTTHFDTILTYWRPLLDDDTVRTIECPHNARFLEFPRHESILRLNKGPGTKSIVMVLERRSLEGTYVIDGHRLECLDPLRESFATGLENLIVYGNGWKDFCDHHPEVTLGYSMPRHLDTNHTPIDHYEKHDFALIIENCDADGYVSEKFGDALIGGAIPLYYGRPPGIDEDCYIDITPFKTGEALQTFIDTLSDEDVTRMKHTIITKRKAYLEARGRRAIAFAVQRAIPLAA